MGRDHLTSKSIVIVYSKLLSDHAYPVSDLKSRLARFG